MDGFGESAGADASSPIPAPKCMRGEFFLHPYPHGDKIFVFGGSNGAISAGSAPPDAIDPSEVKRGGEKLAYFSSKSPLVEEVAKERRYQEYLKLKSKVESLQQTQRNILGEELEHLDVMDLEQLERQLDSSLKTIRSNKCDDTIAQLATATPRLSQMQYCDAIYIVIYDHSIIVV
ncbi:MADS-box protein CMB1-like [Trifolium pratense]|uniref:MADS-box protein CMB1-like n=1 Tax=Trifolium pratense TaxID=57577 RepID=A0A2K3MV78_TRIPR|nr:MADS-box protein CMB1-like [Trifolium pratense]